MYVQDNVLNILICAATQLCTLNEPYVYKNIVGIHRIQY
jgi:hypothetical protein